MARQYTTHAATIRWPMPIWTNILDIAGLKSWILFRKASGSRISCHAFTLQLFEELRSTYIATNSKCRQNKKDHLRPLKKQQKCAGQQCKNNTVTICQHCQKLSCGRYGTGDLKLTECKKCILQQEKRYCNLFCYKNSVSYHN